MFRKTWRSNLTSRKLFWIARLAALVSILPATSGRATAEALNPQQQLAFDIYKELLEIDTTTATGDEYLYRLVKLLSGGG